MDDKIYEYNGVMLEDVIPVVKKDKNDMYARKGDKVRLISQSTHVVILEHPNGKRFPCHQNKVKL